MLTQLSTMTTTHKFPSLGRLGAGAESIRFLGLFLVLEISIFCFLKGSWSRNFKKGSKPLDSLEPQGFYNLALLLVISLENAVFVDF